MRSRGAHPFAFMTCSMGGLIARCIGLVRNTWGIALTNLIYNLARYEPALQTGNISKEPNRDDLFADVACLKGGLI